MLLLPLPAPPPFCPLLHDSLLMNVRRWCELIRSVAHDCRRRGFASRVAGFGSFRSVGPSDAPAPPVFAAAPPSSAFLFPAALENPGESRVVSRGLAMAPCGLETPCATHAPVEAHCESLQTLTHHLTLTNHNMIERAAG